MKHMRLKRYFGTRQTYHKLKRWFSPEVDLPRDSIPLVSLQLSHSFLPLPAPICFLLTLDILSVLTVSQQFFPLFDEIEHSSQPILIILSLCVDLWLCYRLRILLLLLSWFMIRLNVLVSISLLLFGWIQSCRIFESVHGIKGKREHKVSSDLLTLLLTLSFNSLPSSILCQFFVVWASEIINQSLQDEFSTIFTKETIRLQSTGRF